MQFSLIKPLDLRRRAIYRARRAPARFSSYSAITDTLNGGRPYVQ